MPESSDKGGLRTRVMAKESAREDREDKEEAKVSEGAQKTSIPRESAHEEKNSTPETAPRPSRYSRLSKLRAFTKNSSKRTFFNAFFACTYALALWSWASAAVGVGTPYHLTMYLFHRILGIVYTIAFASIWVQIIGLCGENGILPMKDTMEILRGVSSKRTFPTIFWYNTSDKAIRSACAAGFVASILYTLNIVPTLSLAGAWVLFLSFKTVGREFFALQFDNLLLDAGFLAFLLPPIRFLPFLTIPTSHFYQQSVLWLVRWLGFRLMVGSGLCKITSGDPTWRDGTALCYHYWSQPMPSWISYYADRMPPLLFQRISCYYHFFVELAVPFGLFFVALSMPSFLMLASLQIGILITGNYGTFNLLSILIPFTAIADKWYPNFFYNFFSATAFAENPTTEFLPLSMALNLFALVLVGGVLLLSLVPFVQATRGHLYFPEWIADVHSTLSPFGILNYYGLFAQMTTSRREVIIEGSDGEEWKEYEFRYKVDNPSKLPRYVIGHLPRLDWRLWFCQFQQFNPSRPGWYEDFVQKLLEGSPEVLSLLSHNPFPDKPPRYIRSLMYDYKFASEEERKQGLWWNRSKRKLWWPPCALNDSGRMVYMMKSFLLN